MGGRDADCYAFCFVFVFFFKFCKGWVSIETQVHLTLGGGVFFLCVLAIILDKS